MRDIKHLQARLDALGSNAPIPDWRDVLKKYPLHQRVLFRVDLLIRQALTFYIVVWRDEQMQAQLRVQVEKKLAAKPSLRHRLRLNILRRVL